jgi:hypothetical protein
MVHVGLLPSAPLCGEADMNHETSPLKTSPSATRIPPSPSKCVRSPKPWRDVKRRGDGARLREGGTHWAAVGVGVAFVIVVAFRTQFRPL